MLVIVREPDEKIVVGDEITLTLLEVKGDQAYFCVDVPDSLEVSYEELKYQAQKQLTTEPSD